MSTETKEIPRLTLHPADSVPWEIKMVVSEEDARELQRELSEANARVERADLELESILKHMPNAIRVREGGAFENLFASVAVSVSAMTAQLSTLQAALALSEGKCAEKDAALKALIAVGWDADNSACAPLLTALESAEKALASTGHEWADRMRKAEEDAEEIHKLTGGDENGQHGVHGKLTIVEAVKLLCGRLESKEQCFLKVRAKLDAALTRCRKMEEAMKRALATPHFKQAQGSKFISDAIAAPAGEKADPQPHRESEIHTRFEP